VALLGLIRFAKSSIHVFKVFFFTRMLRIFIAEL
jgi:hypothetical protein